MSTDVGAQIAHVVRQSQLAARLAPWKIPAHILALHELPVTERGKTDRKSVGQLLDNPPR